MFARIYLAVRVDERQVFVHMHSIRFAVVLVAALLVSGCGRPKVVGYYRDAQNADVAYELRVDGTWVATVTVGVPAGVFPHGSDRRLEGTYGRRGKVIELTCRSVRREDPMTGEFAEEPLNPSSCNHYFRAEDGKLVPIGADGQTEAVFASDLNPLGARELVRVGD